MSGSSAPLRSRQSATHVRERWRARLVELQIAARTRPDAPETKALIGETSALAVQVRDLEARINAADPRHASFVSPRPLDLDAIQALLDDDTLLLEYALGDARSYLWVVSRRDIRVFTLAPRARSKRSLAGCTRASRDRPPSIIVRHRFRRTIDAR